MTNKILRILKNQLPPVESDNVYSVRFRAISEDKNRISHWSPVFVIESTTPVQIDGDIVITGPLVISAWEDEENRPYYDVFVKFDSDPYIYHGTTPIHTYTFLNEALSTVRVKVQIVGSAKTSNATLTIWESDVTSV